MGSISCRPFDPEAAARQGEVLRGRATSLSWALTLFLAGCTGGGPGSGATPLIATSTSSEVPSPTRAPPFETPEPSSTPPPPSALLAESSVDQPFALAWTPAGDLVAVTTAAGLVLIEAQDLRQPRLIPTEKPLEFLAFSPDGDLLATTEAGTRFQIWALPEGELTLQQEITINRHFGVSFDDHGALYVATQSGGGSLWIEIFEGGQVTGGLAVGDAADWVVDIAIAPAGSFAAFDSFEGIDIWRFNTHVRADVFEGERASALRFSPDSSLLAAAHWDGVARLWSLDSGAVLQSFLWHETDAGGPQRAGLDFSRDGRLLAVAGQEGKILVWDTQSQTIVRSFPIPLRAFNSISFSPDGTKLASIGEDGLLQIWAVGP